MPRYALLIEYDGTPFHGWQRQARGPALGAGDARGGAGAAGPEAIHVQGAGRTDTGVHATGQVAHVDLAPRLGTRSGWARR